MKNIVFAAILVSQMFVARAATIADTFGPSDSYSPNAGGEVGHFERAFHFTIPSTDSYFLDGIEVALGAESPSSTIVFSLMSDAGGLPGIALDSFSFSGVTTTPVEGEIVSGQSSLRPTLLAGQTYWLAARALTDESLIWKFGVSTRVSYAIRHHGDPWELITVEDGDDPSGAFRISGTVVPEPTSTSLVGAGLLLFMFFNKRVRLR